VKERRGEEWEWTRPMREEIESTYAPDCGVQIRDLGYTVYYY